MNVFEAVKQSVTTRQAAEHLKDHSFFRTSKTTIINLRRTKSIRPEIGARLLLTMDNQEKIIVSRQYAGSIKHALGVK